MTLQSCLMISQLLLSAMLMCTVTALKCTKLVKIDGTPAIDEQIFTEGLYAVNTTLPTNSTDIRELAASLKDSNGMEMAEKSFTVTLKPKHIKKVSYINQTQQSLHMEIIEAQLLLFFTCSCVAVSLWCESNSYREPDVKSSAQNY